ncbi:MAG: CPBP family intramembrane metalloprotease [Bacteroidales bacterium]|nr:CPBP family intramembrane metalloprotease [Bacteroidales bacterium]
MENKSKLFSFLHFPISKIIIGLAAVAIATVSVQSGSQAILKYTSLNDDFQNLAVAVLAATAALVAYYYLFTFFEKRKIDELSTSHFLRNVFTGFFTGFLFLSVVILVMYFGKSYTILSFNPVSFLIPALALGISSAVFEEILFRGIIFRITEEKLGSVWALIISSSFFGFAHLANENSTIFSAIAITIEAGLFLGAAYIYSRNLWLPIFIHFAWNFSEGGIYGAIISGNGLEKSFINSKIDGPELITGGAFGPENSLQSVILGLIIGIMFLWMANKKNKLVKPYWKQQKNDNQ